MPFQYLRTLAGLSARAVPAFARSALIALLAVIGTLGLAAAPAAAQTVTASSVTPSTYSGAGQTLTFSYTVNSGSRQVTGASVTSGIGVSYTCVIPPDAGTNTNITFTCTGTYVTTAADTVQVLESATININSAGVPLGLPNNVLIATYAAPPPPTVTSISPTGGPAAGGTTVAINGTNFTGTSAVNFGAVPATSFTVVSPTRINAVAPAGTGMVSVRVTTAGGTSSSSTVSQFTYIPAPTVTSITPASGPVLGGTSVVITGTNFNQVFAISFGSFGTTQFSVDSPTQITLLTPMAAGPGNVPVRVTTAGGTSAINPAVTFTYGSDVAPAITTNPAAQTVTAGTTATFTAAASGTPTPTVQWQQSTNGGTSFSNIAGANSATLSFAAQATQNGHQFRAVFTSSAGTATTTAATLTVNTAPVMTTQPVGGTVAPGQVITLSAAASGTPAPTVQWFISENGGGSWLLLSTSPSFSIISPTPRTLLVRAVFTNAAGSVTSNIVTLTWVRQSQTISFTSAAPSGAVVGGPTYSVSATATSGLNVTFSVDASASSVCSVAGSTVSFIGIGTCTINANQAGNTGYDPAPQVQQSFSVGQGTNVITFPALSDTPYASAPPALSATASSGLAVSYASNSTGVCTVAGSTISFVAGGTCSITASQGGDANYAAATPVTRTFQVTQSPNVITFPALSDTPFTSAPPALSATASSGLAVSYASNSTGVCTVAGGAISFVAAGTCSITASQAGDTTYAAATPVTQTFAVTQGANTITFPALSDTPFTSAPPALSASASSGLAVSYASNSTGVCTVSGGSISFVAAGTCSITASQGGNANYVAAAPITQTFAVTPGTNAITFPALVDTPLTSTPPSPAATASSGLVVSYSTTTTAICTVSPSGTISLVAAGTCTITANQAGNGNYVAANPVSQSFQVTPGVNTITFAALTNRALGSGSFGLAATASSGLAVTFSSSTPGTCSVSGSTVTLLAVGTCTVVANQAGDSNYQAATAVSQSFQITRAISTVTLTSSASTVFFGQPVTLNATVAGVAPTGTVTFNDGTTVLGTVALTGGSASFTSSTLSTGSHNFTATYNGDASNNASTSPSVTVTVNARPDPAADPDVRSSTDQQFRQSERFASTQIDNIAGRLDQLHSDNEGGNNLAVRVNQVRPRLAGNLPIDLDGGVADQPMTIAEARGDVAPAAGTSAAGAAGSTAASAAAGLAQEAPRWSVWASGDVTFGKEQPNGQVESRFTSTGLTVGMDGKFSDNLKLGAAFGFAWDNTRIGINGSENDATNASLSFYGSWRVAPQFYVDGIVGMGYGTIRTTRYSTTGGVFLDGERRTSQTYTALIVTYEGKLGGVEFAPYLRADGIWVHLSPYTETGSPTWALAFQAADETSFSGVVGARLRMPLGKGSRWRIVAKGEYRTRLSGDYTQLVGYADLQGIQGSPYTISGSGVESSVFTGGLGLEGRLRGATVRLNYDASSLAGGNWANRISGALLIAF